MKKAAIIGVLDAIGIEWRGLPYQQWVVLNETQDIRLILGYGNFIHLIDAFKKNYLLGAFQKKNIFIKIFLSLS